MSILDLNLETIASHYGLSPQPIPMDQLVCLEGEGGYFALNVHDGDLAELEWMAVCISELHARTVKGCSSIMRTRNGDVAVKHGDNVVFLTQYIPGPLCDGSNIFEVRAVGRLLGYIHAAADEIIYFHKPPEGRSVPAWLPGAEERVAYWSQAIERGQRGPGGELIRALLHDATESIANLKKLRDHDDISSVFSFPHLALSSFVYVPDSHSVHFNPVHEVFVDDLMSSLGEILLSMDRHGNAVLHFLAAYQGVRPLSLAEGKKLIEYMRYPHEWAGQLDALVRDKSWGRLSETIRDTIRRLERKREWLYWLSERIHPGKRLEGGGKKVPIQEDKREKRQQEDPAASPSLEVVESPGEEVVPEKHKKALPVITWSRFPVSSNVRTNTHQDQELPE